MGASVKKDLCMHVQEKIRSRRERILAGWVQALLDSYPAEGGKFFGRGSNQFSNPVGSTFRRSVAALFDLLVSDAPVENGRDALDGIVRIRAVQGFTPSGAVAPLLGIKDVLRSELEPEDIFSESYLALEKKIDAMLCIAFDQYMQCRETLWKQKANSLYDRTHRLLEKHNLLQEQEKGDSGSF